MTRKKLYELQEKFSSVKNLQTFNSGLITELEFTFSILKNQTELINALIKTEHIPDFLRMISGCSIILSDLIEKNKTSLQLLEFVGVMQHICLNSLNTSFYRFKTEPVLILQDLCTVDQYTDYDDKKTSLVRLIDIANDNLNKLTFKKIKLNGYLTLSSVIDDLQNACASWQIQKDLQIDYEKEIVKKLEMID